jgi:Pyruvate/2-oxoacid:ferredoxin oxidoreductase gamma subunit
MKQGSFVAWIPSYGPEMRGGTAYCTVVISDRLIGSPIIKNPTHLVAMNLPSLEKFENDVKPGGIIFINNAIYGMTGGQMAPTTMPGQRATTAPMGRDTGETGMPIRMANLLAELVTPGYVTRQAVLKPQQINKAKKAIKQAFQYQMENKCFSFVEVVSTCPTNWGMTPLDALKWAEDTLLPYYELGDYKVPE